MKTNFQALLGLMVEKHASHVHLVPGGPIMIRVKKVLLPLDEDVLTAADTQQFADSFLTEDQKYEFRREREINFAYSVAGLSRFRVNVFLQRSSTAIVITTNPPNPPTMDELGLPDMVRKMIRNARQGLVVVCGPYGSGRASTLAALVNSLLEFRTCQIVSIENPIRYLHRNKTGIICQREIGTDCLSYQKAFEGLAHQGADVVVLTELNSYEMAGQALSLAASGTLVLCTSTAPSVTLMLEKLINLYPDPLNHLARNLLSVSLDAVVCQTLVTRADGKGLAPAFEFLVGNPPVKAAIRDGKLQQLTGLMGTGGREWGMQTQEQSLHQLVRKGLVTPEEAMAKAVRPEELKMLMAMPTDLRALRTEPGRSPEGTR